MITKNLQRYSSLFEQYTELRSQENRTLNIGYLRGNLVRNTKNSTSGLSARVYSHGSWGFASTPPIKMMLKRLLKRQPKTQNF